MAERTIDISDLSKHFRFRVGIASSGVLKAVDRVSFSVEKGEVVVLMGESGCGKTTCALTAIRLLKPSGGTVRFQEEDLFSLSNDALRRVRRQIQIVLQNPLSSLDPRVPVAQAIAEPLHIHRRFLRLSRTQILDRVRSIADKVGLREEELGRYPRDLSGGQQQRVCVCRALVLNPLFLVMDEPTSALDVSVQARVLNLLLDLKREFELTYLFVTHSAAVSQYVGDRVAIMYLGQIVEMGDVEQVLEAPLHPYSRGLLGAVLRPDSSISEIEPRLLGTPERAVDLPPGCVFQRRCTECHESCHAQQPELRGVQPGRFVRCHLVSSSANGGVGLSSAGRAMDDMRGRA